jgi:hypothetical protein
MRRGVWLLSLIAGCGGVSAQGYDGGDGGPADAGTLDGGPTRQVWLSATGVQAFTTNAPGIFQEHPVDLATDVDAVTFFGEFYGVPWVGFSSDGGPPAAWVAKMQEVAASLLALNKPIFLSLTIGRDGLTNDVVPEDGGFSTRSGWAPCFDFASDGGGAMKAGYLGYVQWMMASFRPRWVNVAVEINLYGSNCPAAWPGVADVVAGAYAAAKSVDPGVVAFESFAIEPLYGLSNCSQTPAQCYETNYGQIARLPRDRFGVSAYPYGDPALLPADYFTRAANRNPQGAERVVIAETGYNSESIVVGDGVDAGSCQALITGSEALETAYLHRVFSDAEAEGFELIDWWSDRNLLPEPLLTGCPCTYSPDWCAIESFFQIYAGGIQGDLLFKAFGSMGLRAYDGTPKPQVLDAWQAFQALPLAGD